ncbi:unnamed protein product [Linum trigynum]
MMSFGDVHFPGPLPFGPLITRLFSRLEIDLSSFQTISPTQYVSIDQMLDDLEVAIGGEVFPAAAAAVIEVDEAEVEPEDVEPEENVEPEEEDDSNSEDLFPADLVVLYETDEEEFGSDEEDRFCRILRVCLKLVVFFCVVCPELFGLELAALN